MNNTIYKSDHEHKKEAYLLASRSPWLVWRLQALKAGYVPPLVHGQIPQGMLKVPGSNFEDYQIDPLVKHANRVKKRESKLAKRLVFLLSVFAITLMGIVVVYSLMQGSSFRIGLIETLISGKF